MGECRYDVVTQIFRTETRVFIMPWTIPGSCMAEVSNSNTQWAKINNWNKHVFSSLQIYNGTLFHMETNLSCLNIESGTSKACYYKHMRNQISNKKHICGIPFLFK